MKLIITLLIALTLTMTTMPVTAQSALESGEFTTAEVTEGSFSGIVDCIDYCITGICFWLVCTFFGCSIETTAQIDHNLPDLIVSAYPLPGEIAYQEAEGIYGAAGRAILNTQFAFEAGGGDQLETSDTRIGDKSNRKSNPDVVLKEINIVGSPIIEQVSEAASQAVGGYICPSDVEPFEFYYGSEVDGTAWRTGLTELIFAQTFNPLSEVIGNNTNNYWGRIYPRQGFIHQRNDAKAAAVLANRAMHITTRDNQPHIYDRPPIRGAHTRTLERWQIISPEVEDQCLAFGEDVTYGLSTDEKTSDGKYGYIYWGRHRCCVPNAGAFLGAVDTSEICIL